MRTTTAYALAWVSVSVAVTAAIIVTGHLSPLWAFIIPSTISLTSSPSSEGDNK